MRVFLTRNSEDLTAQYGRGAACEQVPDLVAFLDRTMPPRSVTPEHAARLRALRTT